MKNYHALLYFDTEINLGVGTRPNVWVNYKTEFYTDGLKAFSDYTNGLKNGTGRLYLISGDSLEELKQAKFQDIEEWKDMFVSGDTLEELKQAKFQGMTEWRDMFFMGQD